MMKMIRPTEVTDAVLTASNVSEDDYSAWASGTTYAEGDRVIVVADHTIYESVQSGNTGHTPTTDDGTWWFAVSATNAWQMFDGHGGTFTQNDDSIEITLTPGRVNSIALIGLDANSVTVEMFDGVESVYSVTSNLTIENVGDWYEYFYEPIIKNDTLVLTDLPVYSSATIDITIDFDGDTAKCGLCVPGNFRTLGEALWGASTGIIDYSKKETDVFGTVTLLKRAFSKRANFDLVVDNVLISEVSRILAEYRATPVVWVGSEEFDNTVIYGFYRSFDAVISSPAYSECSLEIEGII